MFFRTYWMVSLSLCTLGMPPLLGAVVVNNGGPAVSLREAVLFPFDNHSLPLTYRLRLGLIRGSKHPESPVVRTGEPGDPDSTVVAYYGSVIRVGDELRMWYIGAPKLNAPEAGGWPGWGRGRVCYAVSRDGIHWNKPDLGLVEFEGSRNNNLVDLDVDLVVACSILYEPDDPDPQRRFKMIFESLAVGNNQLLIAYSADGLRWAQSPKNPVLPAFMEGSGLMKVDGVYYFNGQATRFYPKRVFVTRISYDFENWSLPAALSFRRDNVAPRPTFADINPGEQVHMGAGLWNRGNVILGFYGQWHGHRNNDRRFVSMDLGLVVSQDALHFREPVADFKIVSAAEERDGARPALMQGQGVENLGEKTLYWYGGWRDGGVRLATWVRDRLGFFEVVSARPTETLPPVSPHLVSCPLQLAGPARVFVNADGLSEETFLRFEILDERLEDLSGYSGQQSALVRTDGLRQPVTWPPGAVIEKLRQPVRIRVSFEGLRPEDVRLYAIYLVDED